MLKNYNTNKIIVKRTLLSVNSEKELGRSAPGIRFSLFAARGGLFYKNKI